MKTSKTLSVFLSIVIACFVLSASIAMPILLRPFYYAHIEPLELPQYTGLSTQEIKQAYDEMMDYCLGKDEFSTGVLRWSESGRDHFVDVKRLFLLDLAIFAGSALILVGDLILRNRRTLQPYRFLHRGPGFWSAAGLAGFFSLIGIWASLDFNRAFTLFHTLFFPGKENWIFDYRTDEIILILPQVFFRNCAIFIVSLLLLWCIVLIVTDVWLGRKMRPQCRG